jgi:flagellin-like protein
MFLGIGRKAISPMIATVLLIAFTVAVGGILSVWLTTLTATQTGTTGTAAEKQILCARSVLEISEVKSSLGAADSANVTVFYSYGTENLYNFSITFIDDQRVSATTFANVTPQYNDTVGQRFEPGMLTVWNINAAQGLALGGSSLQSVRVRALCQSTYPVSGECKAGQACMK